MSQSLPEIKTRDLSSLNDHMLNNISDIDSIILKQDPGRFLKLDEKLDKVKTEYWDKKNSCVNCHKFALFKPFECSNKTCA